MLRHLKNANELILYASISCGAAFIGRLYPAFYFPILLLRLGISGYCLYIIAGTEGNKELAILLGSAIFLGMVGGYWDLIEVYLRYDSVRITSSIMLILCVLLTITGVILHIKTNGKTSKR
jgi:hypothetical protein